MSKRRSSSGYPKLSFYPRIRAIYWLTGILIAFVYFGGFWILGQTALSSYKRAAQEHQTSLETLSIYEDLSIAEWTPLNVKESAVLGEKIARLKLLDASSRPQEIERLLFFFERDRSQVISALIKQLALDGRVDAGRRARIQTESFLIISKQWLARVWLMIVAGYVLLWLLGNILILMFVKPLTYLTDGLEGLLRGHPLLLRRFPSRIVPREVLLLWVRIHCLMRKVARSRDDDFRRLQAERQRALDLAASLSDGVFCFHDSELRTLNPAAKKMIAADSSLLPRVMEILKSGVEASVEVIFPDGIQRGSYILRRAHLLDSSGIVIAQDVTRIREAEKAKTHFLGLLSHEIRTPVTSLVLAIRILERGENTFDNAINQKLIATCSKDVERLRELLDDLLSISRFESITQSCPVSLSLRNSDLKRILRNAEESFRAEAVDRGIRLESQVVENSISQAVSGAAWTSEVDAAKLGWALSNLINHAVRQTSRGGEVRVSLRRSQSADGRRFFEYRVQDSGNGIPPDQMNKILEPYSGVYDLRVARTELTGSSLSIARQVAEAHGGSLRVCSAPGQGSEFQLRFPSKERSQDGKVACG